MKKLLIPAFVLISIGIFAQPDTIVQKCTDWNVFRNASNFRFQKPTLLILEYTNSDKSVDKGYYRYEGGLLNGVHYVIAGTGIYTDSGTYVNGLSEGIYITRDRKNGHLLSQATSQKGKNIGECREWEYNGKLNHTASYVDGIKNGKEIYYYDNGRKAEESIFKNGEPVDTIHTWSRDGAKMKISFYDSADHKRYEIYYNSFVENFGIGKLDFYTRQFPEGDSRTKRWNDQWDSIRKPYYLYEQPNDTTPATYAHGGYVSLVDPSFWESGFEFPAAVLLTKEENGWYQVMIGNSYSADYSMQFRKFWIKKATVNCGYTPWEKYLSAGMYCRINDLKSNPILKSPHAKAEPVNCQTDNCLITTEVKGEWIKVSIPRCHDCSVMFSKDCFQEGWIRWRNANQFLIHGG